MAKADLIAKAESLGLTLTGDETVADLEKMIDDADQDGNGVKDISTQRRRVSRGSSRRILRALSNFQKATDAFIAEMDLQVFDADEDGNRVGEWGLLKEMRDMKEGVSKIVTELVAPPNEKTEGGEGE